MTYIIPVLSILILLVSCGGPEISRPPAMSNPGPELPEEYPAGEYEPEIVQYYDLIDVERDIPAVFRELESPVIGRCTTFSSQYRYIQIDPVFWRTASDSQREQLVLHELGHCELDREHTEKLDGSGNPTSIMYPNILPESEYMSNRKFYIRELVGKE